MARLKDRVGTAVMETRILVIGTQVLLGFQFRAPFESTFTELPQWTQWLQLGATTALILGLALLLVPGAVHRIALGGETHPDVARTAYRVLNPVLALFALALGFNVFMAFERVLGTDAGMYAAGVLLVFAGACFFGLELVQRPRRAGVVGKMQSLEEKLHDPEQNRSTTHDKIMYALAETRVVLPGAQALLGFQFATVLMERFEELPFTARLLHLASMSFISIAIVLLMAPPAYHRLVERGHETLHFLRMISRTVVAAMVPLSLGLASDFTVVVWRVLDSERAGWIAGGAALAVMWTLWFGYALLRRRSVQRPQPGTRLAEA